MSAASSNSSGTTVEDLPWESSYWLTRAAFLYDLENIEDLPWESSSSASFVSRQDSSRRQLLRKVGENSYCLLVLSRQLNQLRWSAIHPYIWPRRRIKQETDNVLTKASALVSSKGNIIRRVFTTIPTSSIEKVLLELENAIENVSWLIRVAGYDGLPPIANDEPILYFIWEQVAKLLKGSPKDQAAAATELGSHGRYRKLIIKEGGVHSLLKVLDAGKDVEAQERAAEALGLLSREGPWGVDVMVKAGICFVFAKVLKEGAMKVQAMVAWAVSELATHHPQCQVNFDMMNTVQLLVGHLAFETFQEQRMPSAVPVPKAAFIHSVVLADSNAQIRGREQEDPATKSRMKAMAAKALSVLVKDNSEICNMITQTRALLTLAVLLEKGTEEVRSNSAIAIMEIARVAEADNQIRLSAFRPSDPAAKAIVNQLLQIVQKAEYNDLLVPSIVALGCLSKTFQATETCLIKLFVRLLDEREADVIELDVMRETVIALTKFAETDNYLCKEHCKAIIDEGGVKHLVYLVCFGEPVVQKPAIILLGYVAKHVPYSNELAELLSEFQCPE